MYYLCFIYVLFMYYLKRGLKGVPKGNKRGVKDFRKINIELRNLSCSIFPTEEKKSINMCEKREVTKKLGGV